MSRDDWFRNKEWSPQIESVFRQKLRRARDKFQPLRIQAGYLVESHPKVALGLLAEYFQLGDHFDKAQGYVDQARAHLALGNKEQAINSLQLGLKREREFPNLRTQARSEYALLVATDGEEHLYSDALSVLSEQTPVSLSFPVDKFRWFAAHAIICGALGDSNQARESALKALEWSEVTHSGFRYHPKLGLVGTKYEAIKERLQKLGSR